MKQDKPNIDEIERKVDNMPMGLKDKKTLAFLNLKKYTIA